MAAIPSDFDKTAGLSSLRTLKSAPILPPDDFVSFREHFQATNGYDRSAPIPGTSSKYSSTSRSNSLSSFDSPSTRPTKELRTANYRDPSSADSTEQSTSAAQQSTDGAPKKVEHKGDEPHDDGNADGTPASASSQPPPIGENASQPDESQQSNAQNVTSLDQKTGKDADKDKDVAKQNLALPSAKAKAKGKNDTNSAADSRNATRTHTKGKAEAKNDTDKKNAAEGVVSATEKTESDAASAGQESDAKATGDVSNGTKADSSLTSASTDKSTVDPAAVVDTSANASAAQAAVATQATTANAVSPKEVSTQSATAATAITAPVSRDGKKSSTPANKQGVTNDKTATPVTDETQITSETATTAKAATTKKVDSSASASAATETIENDKPSATGRAKNKKPEPTDITDSATSTPGTISTAPQQEPVPQNASAVTTIPDPTAQLDRPANTTPTGGTTSSNADATPPAALRLPAHVLAKNTAEASQGPQLTEVDQTRFIQRVAKAFQAAQERDGEVRLRLSPPELGALKLEVKIQDGVMTARLEAETPAAKALLLDNLPQLKERLADQGIQVASFEVDLMNPQSSGNGGTGNLPQGNDRQPTSTPIARFGREQNSPNTTDSPTAPRPVSATNGRLNVIV